MRARHFLLAASIATLALTIAAAGPRRGGHHGGGFGEDHDRRGGYWGHGWGDDDESDDTDATACLQAATSMRKSCEFEVEEEYHATRAACVNFADEQERDDCLESADEARSENAEGCFDVEDSRVEICELLGESIYDPDPLTDDALGFVDPDEIGDAVPANPYFSLQAGHTYVLRAGEGFEETVVVHVTEESLEVLGVACRLVVDVVVLGEDGDYEPVEVTDDYYAQSAAGDVYYCGELARNFEDGRLTDLDGSFLAGVDLAKSGILIRAAPAADEAHRQEYKLGEAEDVIRYVGLAEAPGADEGGENPDPAFACGANGGCLKTEEFVPPEPEVGEFKYYLAGTGFVLGVALEDGVPTGERDELLCSGDSLDVLSEPGCEIDDPDALLEALCRLAPDFCVSD